jgi:hypothetical protein
MAGIADGDGSDGLGVRGNFECLFGFGGVKSRHLVHDQATGSGFDAEKSGCGASIVESVAIWVAIALELEARNGKNKYLRVFGPAGIELHQDAKHFRKVFWIVLGRDQVNPRLLIAARGSPPRGFEQRGEDLMVDGLVGKGSRTPAITDQFMYGECGRCWIVHENYSFSPDFR